MVVLLHTVAGGEPALLYRTDALARSASSSRRALADAVSDGSLGDSALGLPMGPRPPGTPVALAACQAVSSYTGGQIRPAPPRLVLVAFTHHPLYAAVYALAVSAPERATAALAELPVSLFVAGASSSTGAACYSVSARPFVPLIADGLRPPARWLLTWAPHPAAAAPQARCRGPVVGVPLPPGLGVPCLAATRPVLTVLCLGGPTLWQLRQRLLTAGAAVVLAPSAGPSDAPWHSDPTRGQEPGAHIVYVSPPPGGDPASLALLATAAARRLLPGGLLLHAFDPGAPLAALLQLLPPRGVSPLYAVPVGAGASTAVCIVYARAGGLRVPPAPGAALVSDFPCLLACLESLRVPDLAGGQPGLARARDAPPPPLGPPALARPGAAKRLGSPEGLATWITHHARL